MHIVWALTQEGTGGGVMQPAQPWLSPAPPQVRLPMCSTVCACMCDAHLQHCASMSPLGYPQGTLLLYHYTTVYLKVPFYITHPFQCCITSTAYCTYICELCTEMVVCQTNIRLPADLPKLNNRSADCVERSISLALVASLQYRCSFYT